MAILVSGIEFLFLFFNAAISEWQTWCLRYIIMHQWDLTALGGSSVSADGEIQPLRNCGCVSRSLRLEVFKYPNNLMFSGNKRENFACGCQPLNEKIGTPFYSFLLYDIEF